MRLLSQSKKCVKKAFPYVIGIAGFCLLFWLLGVLCKPKWLFESESLSPETDILTQFYEEPRDSLDVIFLGSSHVYNGVNPLDFYETTGLTGYVLASSDQDLATSYFYLREALRYQKPSYVFLDLYGFLRDSFANEASYRRSLDDMRWSNVKWEAVRCWQDALGKDRDETLFRLFPLLDYHDRWEELSELDFTYLDRLECVKGFLPTFESEEFTHVFDKGEDFSLTQNNRLYFGKLSDLCRSSGIQLVLIDIPSGKLSYSVSASVGEMASKEGVSLWEFNEEGLYASVGFDETADFRDAGHLNAYGAEKFTSFLGRYFLDRYPAGGGQTFEIMSGWERAGEEWAALKQRKELARTRLIEEYLTRLQNEDYLILVASQGNFTLSLTDAAREGLAALGSGKTSKMQGNAAYCGLYQGGRCLEETVVAEGQAGLSEKIDGLDIAISVGTVSDTGEEPPCSILIRDQEYATRQTGLNFVIYSLSRGEVIDAVTFNTHTNEEAKR